MSSYYRFKSIKFSGLLALEGYINKMGAPKWPWSVNNSLAAQRANIFSTYFINKLACIYGKNL
jgi:hypothetical protein